jgi:hypothetical protein
MAIFRNTHNKSSETLTYCEKGVSFAQSRFRKSTNSSASEHDPQADNLYTACLNVKIEGGEAL